MSERERSACACACALCLGGSRVRTCERRSGVGREGRGSKKRNRIGLRGLFLGWVPGGSFLLFGERSRTRAARGTRDRGPLGGQSDGGTPPLPISRILHQLLGCASPSRARGHALQGVGWAVGIIVDCRARPRVWSPFAFNQVIQPPWAWLDSYHPGVVFVERVLCSTAVS